MISVLLACAIALQQPQGSISRDSYGVPSIKAPTGEAAWYWAGRAIAQDRPWQLEVSRRSARGRLAEALGASAVASDKEVLKTGYTDQELQRQFDGMSQASRAEWRAYAQGITDGFATLTLENKLPPEFASAGVEPEAWSVLDSAAIAVRMARLFGTGGGGELRNYLLFLYLKSQPCKDQVYDVIDDLAWQLDPGSVPTVPPADDPIKQRPNFGKFTREDTIRQTTALPPSSLFELLPAIRLAERENERRVAERENVLFKAGSYCIVVSPKRSGTGYPLLLSGPQMGHRTPSIAHEMAINTPGLKVSGLNVPGIPTIMVGYSPTCAWGLTSGIGDLSDVVFNKLSTATTYNVDGKDLPLEVISRTFKVKGAADETVIRKRTQFGPVVLESSSAKVVYSLKSSLWMRELAGFDNFKLIGMSKSPKDFAKIAAVTPVTFNLFFATTGGDIGYYYCGDIPLRPKGIDPRFPVPGSKKNAWLGFVPKTQMPHVVNPSGGLLANWNNQPASWWPNLDTPAWGKGFRNEALLGFLKAKTIGVAQLEAAIRGIAMSDTDYCNLLAPFVKKAINPESNEFNATEKEAARLLVAFDGKMLDGSKSSALYAAFTSALRDELFVPSVGTFLSPANMALVVRVTVMLNALNRETKFDYLGKQTPEEVAELSRNGNPDKNNYWPRTADEAIVKAFKKAVAATGTYRPETIKVPGEPDILYGNRGTFIQIVQLAKKPIARSVLSPGITEAGTHSRDQAPLAREWKFKTRNPW